VTADVRRAVGERLASTPVEVPVRKQWPSRLDEVAGAAARVGDQTARGRIGALGMAGGRALGREGDGVIDQLLSEALTQLDDGGDLPDPLRRRAVQLLSSWDWDRRPSTVTAVADGSGHGRVAVALADHLAEVGRLRRVPDVTSAEPLLVAEERSNSVQVAAGHLRSIPDVPTCQGDDVLVVLPLAGTGWAPTVVAARLRSGGARSVLALALHARG
jgi:ATP-dependent DNA helicase RecQ